MVGSLQKRVELIAESASDGIQALDLWKQHQYDLIIMDCQGNFDQVYMAS